MMRALRIMLLALLLSGVAQAGSVWAQTPPADTGTPAQRNTQTVDSSGNRINCADVDEARAGVLLGYIMPCMQRTVQNATEHFLVEVIDLLEPIVFAFITLVVVLFGVKMVTGNGQELSKEGFVLVIKIAFVVGLLAIIPQLPQVGYGIITDGMQIVANGIGTDGIRCDIDHYRDGNTPLIWAQMDCLVGKLYGFTTGTNPTAAAGTPSTGPNMLLASSAFGLMTGFFFGGTLGMTVFFVLVGVLWSILQLVIKVALSFINSYLILSLMLILSPLFLPLILLRATSQYFDGWWKLCLSCLLLPMLITAYAVFGMKLYDRLLFADDSEIKVLFDNRKIQQALALPKRPCSGSTMAGLSDFRQQGQSETALNALMKNPFMHNIDALVSGGNNICGAAKLPDLQIEKVDSPAFRDKQAIFVTLFKQFIKLLIATLIIDAGLASVLQALRYMGISSSVASSLFASSPMEQKLSSKIANAKSGAMGAVGNSKGAEFITRLKDVAPAAGRGLLGKE